MSGQAKACYGSVPIPLMICYIASSCRLLCVERSSAVVGAAARQAPDGLLHFVTWVHSMISVGRASRTLSYVVLGGIALLAMGQAPAVSISFEGQVVPCLFPHGDSRGEVRDKPRGGRDRHLVAQWPAGIGSSCR